MVWMPVLRASGRSRAWPGGHRQGPRAEAPPLRCLHSTTMVGLLSGQKGRPRSESVAIFAQPLLCLALAVAVCKYTISIRLLHQHSLEGRLPWLSVKVIGNHQATSWHRASHDMCAVAFCGSSSGHRGFGVPVQDTSGTPARCPIGALPWLDALLVQAKGWAAHRAAPAGQGARGRAA